jgi:glutamyl-tRNA synthetase
MTVRLRFAPSPTGYLHIGSARSALFTWMYAKRHNGKFLIRIEDTDQKRSVEGAIENVFTSLRWLGLDWDEGPDIGGSHAPYIQTERAELYQKWAHWLVDNGFAYKCFCTPEELAKAREESGAGGYNRRCRNLSAAEVDEKEAGGLEYVIRHKMPLEGNTIVPDLVRGDVVFENDQLTDFVILKSGGLPTYHLAHVVDDHFMEITHVTRGIEWLSTAPVHVNLFKAFGWDLPVYAHMPVILNPNGKGKLSKRTQAFNEAGHKIMVRVEEFQEGGYLPEAVVNFLANVGWSFGDDREMFPIEEAVARFDLADINPAETILPYDKLDWLNGQYIQELSAEQLAEALRPFLEAEGYQVNMDALLVIAPSLNVRLKRLPEAVEILRFLFEDELPILTVEGITDKNLDRDAARDAFAETRALIETLEPYTAVGIGEGLRVIGEKHSTNGKAGPYLGRMRQAMTGQKVSPPLFESMEALGRERTLAHLDNALSVLNE